MDSAHHFSYRPDCNSTADVPSFILRTALSAILIISDLCGVDVQWFQERSSQYVPNSKENQCKWLLVSRRPQEILQALLRFLGSFCFTSVWLYPLCCQVFYHYSVSIIVSRFTSFTENFVIRSCRIIQNVPLWARLYQCVFCKEPLWFWFSGRYRNFGPSGSEKNAVLTRSTFARGPESNSREELEASRCSWTLSSTRPCLKSCGHSGRSCNKFPRSSSLSTFLGGFSVYCWSMRQISLYFLTHTLMGVTLSCDEGVGKVGEDEVEELVDRPGTTKGT